LFFKGEWSTGGKGYVVPVNARDLVYITTSILDKHYNIWTKNQKNQTGMKGIKGIRKDFNKDEEDRNL
jgi:hypothetical protein